MHAFKMLRWLNPGVRRLNPGLRRLVFLAVTAWALCLAVLLGADFVAQDAAWVTRAATFATFALGAAGISAACLWVRQRRQLRWLLQPSGAPVKGKRYRIARLAKTSKLASVATAVLLGAALVGAQLATALQARSEFLEQHRGSTKITELRLRVSGYPQHKGENFAVLQAETVQEPRVTVRLHYVPVKIAAGSAGHELSGQKSVGAAQAGDNIAGELTPGAEITVSGNLQPEPVSRAAAATVRVSELRLTVAGPAVFRGTQALRQGLLDFAAQQPGLKLLPGFTFGDTQLLDPADTEQLRRAGLLHLTAVSGGNCALVIAAAMKTLQWCGVGRRLRLAAALLGLGGFAALVGPDPSLQRAAVMAAIMLSSRFGTQRSVGIAHLATAVLVLLWLNPWQAVQLGFVLSVFATAAILSWAPALTRALGGERLKIISLPLGITLAAQLGVAPILILLTPEITLAAVPANLAAAPLAPVLTGGGLLLLLLLPLLPGAANLIALPLQAVAWLLERIAAAVTQLPFATLPWVPGVAGAVLLALLEILVAALLLHNRARKRAAWGAAWKPGSSARRYLPTVPVAAALTMLALLFTPRVFGAAPPPDWAVVACDVGQGDSLLIRNPAHPASVLLIDTGDNQQKLQRCLQQFGVTHLAAMVLTHDDKDHVGAVDLATAYTEHAIIAPQPGGAKRKLLRRLEQDAVAEVTAGTEITVTAAGQVSVAPAVSPAATPENTPVATAESASATAAVSCQVLWPRSRVVTGTNEASLVLHCNLGQLRVLLLADTGAAQHAMLLTEYGAALEAEIVKAAHHGSRDQDPRLLQLSRPKYAIYSAGAGNSYGHPTREALQAGIAAGAQNLRTDTQGSIAITNTTVWTSANAAQ
ncbi:ComEC/Rec2 family competence protein [Canibacter oris]|uniref:Competence protein ComEC n=1 Tax=Canibacter oris TaxID=1365628 RepID=A0A840DMT4_9MICO|nr:ComEC/Rec2 family competence protein [Canibacter oris]MBB4071347.1 competence protein ComEC [Canibacter oris]